MEQKKVKITKKKKMVAIIVCVCFCITIVVGGIVGLRLRGTIVGTEAAKILNARNRLNITVNESGSWNEIMGEIETESNKGEFLSQANKTGLGQNTAYAQKSDKVLPGTVVKESSAAKIYKDGNKYHFQNISGASNTGIVVESRFFGIDFDVERAAEIIDIIKNQLNITNKWVEIRGSEYLLTVEDNLEKLFCRYATEGGMQISVCERTTRDDAKSVYQMYYDILEGDEIKRYNPSYMVYIPNERYEYYYEHDGNGTDYVIAENERGYWNILMPNVHKDGYGDCSNLVIKNGFAYYNSSGLIDENSTEISCGEGGVVISNDLKHDIISISGGHNSSSTAIYLENINNLSYFSTNEENISIYDSSVFFGYQVNDGSNIEVVLTNGSVIKTGDVVTTDSGTVEVGVGESIFYTNPGFADEQQSARILLDISGGTVDEKLKVLYEFFDATGIEFAYDKNSISSTLDVGSDMFDSISDNYLWNGERINTLQGLIDGQKNLHQTWDYLLNEFNKVKDNEKQSVINLEAVGSSTNFANVRSLVGENNSYSNNIIKIDNLALTVDKSRLLENGKSYILKVGISKAIEGSEYTGEFTVGLKAKNGETKYTYEGSNLTLTQSGEYELPSVLDEGNYVIVAYVATADEEIRVSKIVPIAFLNTEEEMIENDFSVRKVWSNNGSLMVNYTPNLEIVVSMKEIKATYTYNEVRRALMSQILACGYPIFDAEITNANGETIDENAELGSGTYKLKFHMSSKEAILGYVEAYVIVNV